MNLDEKYLEVLAALERGDRYQKPLSPDDILYLKNKLEEFTQLDSKKLNKILCIMTNTATFIQDLEPKLIKIIQAQQTRPESIIYTLNCARKHIIAAQFRQGKRLSADFLDSLMGLLTHHDPEVVEWTLRTIDECGSQAILFRAKLKEIRPSIFKLFNRHQRAILEIIEHLERKWSSHEKARPQ